MALIKKFLHDANEIQERHRRSKEDPPQKPHADDESNWLISYADMMTLLCGFFIMLFSMARLDEAKYESIKAAIAKEFKGAYEPPSSSETAKFVSQIIEEVGIKKDTLIESDPKGVTIIFQSTVFFDTLSAEVGPEGKKILDRLIDSLSERQKREKKEYQIVIEGHTDSRPIVGGVFPSNWELSGARAARVVRFFIEKGFNPRRMTATGYAETRPLSEAKHPDGTWDEDALSKNRRVVLHIFEPQIEVSAATTAH